MSSSRRPQPVSVNRLNAVLAEVRGAPVATIEMYSRSLRKAGVLPETRRGGGGDPVTTKHAAYMLLSIMQGSPTAAAENARETGDLNVNWRGGLEEPIVAAKIGHLGWDDGITLAEAVAWLIDRHVDGTIEQYTSPHDRGIKVTVDRYWTTATLTWQPAADLARVWSDASKKALSADIVQLGPNDLTRDRMEIGFHTPLLYQVKQSFAAGDKQANREAHDAFQALKKERSRFDLWGSETVTSRTLEAIAALFRAASGREG